MKAGKMLLKQGKTLFGQARLVSLEKAVASQGFAALKRQPILMG